jgi:RNA polymerase sigma-70 factor (ECF subfamily)
MSDADQVLQRELPAMYRFAFLMCGTRAAAVDELRAWVPTARTDLETGMPALTSFARHLEKNFEAKSPHTFASLDRTLRSDITRPIDLRLAGLTDDPRQVHLLTWELKRTCLTAVLSSLPAGVRLSLLLTDVMEIGPDDAAAIIEIKASAYRVRLTRARKRVEDYLAPRCHHVDRANPCTCMGRLMIALDADFVRAPDESRDDIPHTGHDEDGPQRDVGNLYRRLPAAKMTAGELADVLAG